MADRIRRFFSAVLRLVNLRPPRGHMNMLRGEMTDREDERLARDADVVKRRAAKDAERVERDSPEAPH